MIHIYRIVYGDLGEAWVEVEDQVIRRVIHASLSRLIGQRIDELPSPRYFEIRLLSGDEALTEIGKATVAPRPAARKAPHTYDGRPCYACARIHPVPGTLEFDMEFP